MQYYQYFLPPPPPSSPSPSLLIRSRIGCSWVWHVCTYSLAPSEAQLWFSNPPPIPHPHYPPSLFSCMPCSLLAYHNERGGTTTIDHTPTLEVAMLRGKLSTNELCKFGAHIIQWPPTPFTITTTPVPLRPVCSYGEHSVNIKHWLSEWE